MSARQPCGGALKSHHVKPHVCIFPAGVLHDSMLKGSLQRHNRGINITAAPSREEEGKHLGLHRS